MTIDSVPGAIFFISTGLSAVALLLSVYILISLRGKSMSEVTAKGAGRNEEKTETEETDVTYM